MHRLLVVLVLLVPTIASAQERCVAALIQDKGRLDFHETTSLSLAWMLKQASTSSSEWEANITVPIYNVPGEFGGKGAKRATEDYFARSNTEWSQDRIVSVATQSLSKNAVEAYKTCIHAHPASGPRITAYAATSDAVTIQIHWIAPPRAPTKSNADIFVSGGHVKGNFLKKGEKWETNTAVSRIVERDPLRDFRITADIGGETASEIVYFIPPFVPAAPRLTMGSCLGRGGVNGVRLWGPTTESCNGIKPWGAYDAQVRDVELLGSCEGHGGLLGVRLYGPIGEPCGGIADNKWGTYVTPVDVRTIGISSCLGQLLYPKPVGSPWNFPTKVIEGHRLWGPHGEPCGGKAEWGKYDEFNMRPR